jgi:hypothetical protein
MSVNEKLAEVVGSNPTRFIFSCEGTYGIIMLNLFMQSTLRTTPIKRDVLA